MRWSEDKRDRCQGRLETGAQGLRARKRGGRASSALYRLDSVFRVRRREAHSRRSWLGNGRNFNFKGTATCRGGGGRSFLRRPSIILPLRSPEKDAPSLSALFLLFH